MDEISVVLNNHGYTLMESIGYGGFSTVYKVYSQKYNQHFAVKIIQTNDQYLIKAKIATYKNEIAILQNIQHNYIVNIYDFFNEGNLFFIILEYCPGGTIEKYIKSTKTLLFENSRNLMIFQMFSAVAFCHGHNIAHHDIKPSNFFIGEGQHIKLGDFGCAAKESQESKEYAGTYVYLAPEVSDHAKYDPFKADIWSLGVTILQIITHHLPNYSDKREDVMKKIESDIAWLDKNTQPYMKNIICRALTIDPAKRAGIQELIEMITPYLPEKHKYVTHKLIIVPYIFKNKGKYVRSHSTLKLSELAGNL